MTLAPWIPAVLVAMGAGILDWRYRRIPNWLTVSGLAAGVAVNTILFRWPGLKAALLGTALGLGLLLPFVLLRSLGAGDWKLAGALGACLGPRQLFAVLMGTILVAGVMALAMVIWKGRLKRTLLNMAHLLARCSACGCLGLRYRSTIRRQQKFPSAWPWRLRFCSTGWAGRWGIYNW